MDDELASLAERLAAKVWIDILRVAASVGTDVNDFAEAVADAIIAQVQRS